MADIYHQKDRNTPMALFTGSVLFGTGFGPIIGSLIAQHMSWRWIFWVHSIAIGVVVSLVVLFFEETRGSVLLSRKAKRLNKWYEECEAAGYSGIAIDDTKNVTADDKVHGLRRVRWKVKADEERGTLAQMIRISLFRPMQLLFTEPTVFFFSLWISFAWGILYLVRS